MKNWVLDIRGMKTNLRGTKNNWKKLRGYENLRSAVRGLQNFGSNSKITLTGYALKNDQFLIGELIFPHNYT